MTRTQANYYLHRCYRLLADPETVLKHKKFRTLHGIAYAAIETMFVDFRKDALSTVIHECLHVLYPQLPEGSILRMEREISNHLSQKQWQNLCLRVGYSGRM